MARRKVDKNNFVYICPRTGQKETAMFIESYEHVLCVISMVNDMLMKGRIRSGTARELISNTNAVLKAIKQRNEPADGAEDEFEGDNVLDLVKAIKR